MAWFSDIAPDLAFFEGLKFTRYFWLGKLIPKVPWELEQVKFTLGYTETVTEADKNMIFRFAYKIKIFLNIWYRILLLSSVQHKIECSAIKLRSFDPSAFYSTFQIFILNFFCKLD